MSTSLRHRWIAFLTALLIVSVVILLGLVSRKPGVSSDRGEISKTTDATSPASNIESAPSVKQSVGASMAGQETPTITSPSQSSIDHARSLLSRLFQLDVSSGKLTAEQITIINEGFKELSDLGPAGIPIIREFLEKQLDLNFADLKGADKLDYTSLRVGLFDSLRQIGGIEGIEATLQVLNSTGDPWEVAILARNLEQLAPGQFREQTLSAARETLVHAREGNLPPADLAPVFQVFQSYGTPDVIADLERAMPQWNYYAAITLASLADGAGIPALIDKVQNPTAAASREGDVALQILAQVSSSQPLAAEALIGKARGNEISDSAWPAVASALAGLELQFGTPLSDSVVGTRLDPSMRQYRVEDGIESLFSLPDTPSLLEEQLGQRIAVVDELLSATTQPAAVTALQSARATLQDKAIALAIPH